MIYVLSALVNLNHRGHYLHWGAVQISVANLIVIVLMLVTFVLALVLPFHGQAVSRHEAERPTVTPSEQAGGAEP
ncbi:MAG TPA: hypothetical protein VEH29_05165 [Acidimicrobiales bacterium]|nr:hypothetical protein [Acidimicrobiales bacterium]